VISLQRDFLLRPKLHALVLALQSGCRFWLASLGLFGKNSL
jgi:hypothetical protein